MSGLAKRIRSVFLSACLERAQGATGPGTWRFHLALGRTLVGSEPKASQGSGSKSEACGSEHLRQHRGPRVDQAAPRPSSRVGGRRQDPRLHEPGPSLRAAAFRRGCSRTVQGFPSVGPVEPRASHKLTRPVVLVRRPLDQAQELGGMTVAVVDPEWGQPVPGARTRLGLRRCVAIREHVCRLAAYLGEPLELAFDAMVTERVHPNGTIERMPIAGEQPGLGGYYQWSGQVGR